MNKKDSILAIFFLAIFPNIIFGQNDSNTSSCSCKAAPSLNSTISCDTIIFNNGSRLYRQFNCDSSWLTFENIAGSKKILYSLENPLLELTERLGYQFVKEFELTLLFENRQVSGGGYPSDYVLIDKNSGDVMENMDAIIDENISNTYILFLSANLLSEVTFFNVSNNSKTVFPIPSIRIRNTMKKSSLMFPEDLFKNPKIENNIYTIEYRYLSPTEKWETDKIAFKL